MILPKKNLPSTILKKQFNIIAEGATTINNEAVGKEVFINHILNEHNIMFNPEINKPKVPTISFNKWNYSFKIAYTIIVDFECLLHKMFFCNDERCNQTHEHTVQELLDAKTKKNHHHIPSGFCYLVTDPDNKSKPVVYRGSGAVRSS